MYFRSFQSRRMARGNVGRFALAALAAVSLSSCDRSEVSAPNPVQIQRDFDHLAFRVRVDVEQGTVTVLRPNAFASANVMASPIKDAPTTSSIISTDGIELTTENFRRFNFGGTSIVRFDMTITNKFNTVDLVTPTWPAPPAGVQGILLFPYRAVATGGDLRRSVDASADWNGTGGSSGAPHNFFNATDCQRDDDCFRWEAFPAPLGAGRFTAPQTVGFTFDSRVTSFDAYLILAADLADQAPRPAGTIAGVVTSPERGPLGTVGISVEAGNFSGATNAAGEYTITGVSSGPRTVSLTRIPSGCTMPASQSIRLERETGQTVNFSMTCTPIQLTANAGADRDVGRGAPVTLDGSGSVETSDDPVTLTWTQVSGPDVTGGVGYLTGTSPTFTAPADVSSVEFDLRLSDGFTTGAADRVQVNVQEDPGNAVFVSVDGRDFNSGTRESPYLTINAAINAAAERNADVYVSAGTYSTPGFSIGIALRSGVSIYGGFAPGTWVRDRAAHVTRVTNQFRVVAGVDVHDLTIDGFHFESGTSSFFSASSQGIWLHSSSNVVISHNVIRAGAGSPGLHGSNGPDGPTGANGAGGGPGSDDEQSNSNFGGAGGFGGSLGLSGGNGGRGGAEGDHDGARGNPGVGVFAGAGGAGGFGGSTGGRGGDGGTGGPGFNGSNGVAFAASIAQYTDDNWQPRSAQSGQRGQAGSGGGGGGGGGGQGCTFCDDGSGNGGGGGGAGGIGGSGGQGGLSGGGSFAIYLWATDAIVIADNEISTSNGGIGGRGGIGGFGGQGGAGGPGNTLDSDEVGAGGNGGNGGRGGNGGIGAGGNGGPSIAIVQGGVVTQATLIRNTISVGNGGAPGPSAGMPGFAGEAAEMKIIP
jgi:hypothetical protein